MFRRIFTPVVARSLSLGATARLPVARRWYTPSEELTQLYTSNFETSSFPCDMVPSDAVLFAKFLYKAAEKSEAYDTLLGDFRKIAAVIPSLPVFWERTCKIDDISEFNNLSEPVVFTLQWMQSNGMLDQLADVAEVYETYVNAKMKRVTVKIYVGEDRSPEALDRAKDVADTLIQSNTHLQGFSPVYKIIVDRSIVKGFSLDVQGMYHNEAEGKQVDTGVAGEADYLFLPTPQLPKTTWHSNIETEVLRSYLNSLSTYDEEEVKHGV